MSDRATVHDEIDDSGRFQRQRSPFRQWVSADGSTGFAAEPGRYHLYVSLACPWAHRTIITRRLRGLEDAVSLSVLDPLRDERGWRFGDETERPNGEPDPINGFELLAEAYEATDPGFDGRVTVPVLWDKQEGRIVNNESADVIVMLDQAFAAHAATGLELYPAHLREEMDALNAYVYDNVNDGVYRSGFAGTQRAHGEAVTSLFEGLDYLDERLADRRYLMGEQLTLADIRLFTTLVRFDPVYVGHFKCNLRRIADYEHLPAYTRDLFQTPRVAETVDLDHIKRHYYMTHPSLNPRRIVPLGPRLDYETPHGREALGRDARLREL